MEEEILDWEDEVLDDNELSDGSSDDEGSDDAKDASKKSGKSNFNKLSKALKEERRQNAELIKRLQSVEDYITKHTSNIDPKTNIDNSNETNLRLFLVEVPDAKEYKEEIKQAIIDYPWISLEKAFLVAKAIKPQPSKSKTDFDLSARQKPKDMKQMTDDEAVERLSPTEYLKYSREVLWIKI